MALDVSVERSGAQTPFRAYPSAISELKEFFTEVKISQIRYGRRLASQSIVRP